jgi:dTDP-4-amino-4,6-dideoxygalactose transaminase
VNSARPEFAAFGGTPTFADPLHVAQLNLPDWDKVEQVFRDIFRRRYFANHGPLVRQLERAIAARLGVEHAVCVTNGTVGLMVLAKALELSGEVIVPAFTFPATVHALAWAGIEPVLCDVSRDTHMVTPATVAPLLTPRTVGILAVHLWGRVCDVDALQHLADRRGVQLIFDSCHAIGCTRRARQIGGFGAAEVFSFHATKIVNAAEGGCITTNDARLAAGLRTIRNFHATETFAPVALRMNGKMSEAQAALALLSLDDLADNIAANRRRYAAYTDGLSGIPGVELAHFDDGEQCNFQYIVVAVDSARSGVRRDVLMRMLAAENVICRRHFYPGVHRCHPYLGSDAMRTPALPATDRLCQTLLQLPTGQAVTLTDVEQVCELVRRIVVESDRINNQLKLRA